MPAGVNTHIPEFKSSNPQVTAALNDMARGVEMLMNKRSVGRANVTQNGAGIFETPIPDDVGVLYYNGDSGTVPAYGICLMNGNQANGNSCTIKTKKPDTYGCQNNWLVNGAATVATGKYGFGSILGSGFDPDLPGLIVAYDSADGTPTAGQRWGPRNGTYLLKKSTLGFIIVGIFDSTNHYVLVQPEPMFTFRGQPTADVASGATGTVTIYYNGSSTSVTIANVLNDSSCTVKGSKNATCQFMPDAEDTNPWQFVIGRTS